MTMTEPDLGAQLVEQARAIVPELRARAAQTAADRRVPKENIDLMRAAGAFKTLQSTKNGGYGLGMREHLEVMAEIATGCANTAWVAGVTQAHSWLMSHFPVQAQEETYRTNPDLVISAVIGPRGTAHKTADGFVLTGVWPFTSGCENSEFLLLGAVVKDGDEVIDEGDFLVPTNQATILDDWNTVGLSGTGSCTTMVNDLVVPAHRFLSFPQMMMGTAPGTADQDGWNHKAAPVPVLSLALCGSAIGIARQALADFPALVAGKSFAYTAGRIDLHPNTHRMLAEAALAIDAGELILFRAADDIDRYAKAGTEMPFLTRARIRLDCAQGVRHCLDGVEVLFKASGAAGIRTSSPLTRAVADLRAINQHGLLSLEMNQELYGRILLGLEPNTPLI